MLRPLVRLVPFLLLAVLGANANIVYAPQATTGKIIAQSADAYILYDEQTQTWEIGTDGIRRRMDYDPGTGYRLVNLTNKLTGREWLASNSGHNELQLGLDGEIVTGSSRDFVLDEYVTRQHPDGSLELEIHLTRGPLVVHLHYAAYPKTNVLEQWAEIENTGPTPLRDLTAIDSLAFAVAPSSDPLTLYWVQGLNPPNMNDPAPHQEPVLELRSIQLNDGVKQAIGSNGRSSEGSMGWFTLAALSQQEGLFGGIEWSGAWQLQALGRKGATELEAGLQDLRRDLAAGETFESPRRFTGFYIGSLDEAADATHDFARRYLMPARPADFPWTQYNTWFAYYTDLDEERLKREVDSAAQLGLEVFYVDAGWYEGSVVHGDFSWGLGSWREDRTKFPSGLASFADYVHSKGMKFGLWVEPERVDLRYVGPNKEISKDWLAPGTAFDAPPPPGQPQAAQVCLGNPGARAWMKNWLVRIVRDYKLDWLKWDNNLWMSCDPPGQPGHADYEHIQGLYEVLDDVRQQFPNLIIENCASGGNRMDYGLLRRTQIAWLSDQTDPSYRVRYHVFGASYPFPSEYLNSWLVESYFEHLADAAQDPALLEAWLRSRMMGAFGISVSTLGWTPQMRTVVAAEIKHYKSMRDLIATGDHYHLLPQPDLMAPQVEPPTEPDAAEFFDPDTTRTVVFLFKGTTPWANRRVRLVDLLPDTTYQVSTPDGAISLRKRGAELMDQDITFAYPEAQPSTLLFVTPIKTR